MLSSELKPFQKILVCIFNDFWIRLTQNQNSKGGEVGCQYMK